MMLGGGKMMAYRLSCGSFTSVGRNGCLSSFGLSWSLRRTMWTAIQENLQFKGVVATTAFNNRRNIGGSFVSVQFEQGILRSTAIINIQSRFSSSNLKSVSDRIKSIKSIQKITKAMKMIAASKLKGDQRRLEIGLPFCYPAIKVAEYLPLEAAEKADLMIVAISSDKGLCGGVNSAVARQVRQTIAESEAAGNKVLIFGVGDKIRNALQRLYGNRFSRLVNEIAKFPLNFTQAALITERIIQEKPERLKVVYNHFKSIISYETLASDVLTVNQADKLPKHELEIYEFEPERNDLWNDFHEFYYACAIYRAMLDSVTSEQSARLSAMDSASTNAGDMLSKLTLKYNRARQAKITTELIEIISGANAV